MRNVEINQQDYCDMLIDKMMSADSLLLYGAGRYGKELLQTLQSVAQTENNKQIILFIDDTPEKHGTTWCGISVVSVAEGLSDYPDGLVVLCADERSHPILLKKLDALNVPRTRIVIPEIAFWNPHLDPTYLEQHNTELSCVEKFLSDSRSSDVFHAVLRYKMYHDTAPLQKLADPISKRYFDPAITGPLSDGIYLDCGSFRGDTAEGYLAVTGECHGKIICCEPDPRNYSQLCRTIERLGVKDAVLHNKAVWSHQGSMHFQTVSALSGVISDEGEMAIEADTIDHMIGNEKLGFLKIEVNGSEYEALLGGTYTIQRDQPLITVSVYHNTEDLIRIPLLLKGLNPDYRLFLRYYGLRSLTDIVCYAIPCSK